VATKGDEVVVAFFLSSLEAERHGLILGYRVRAFAHISKSRYGAPSSGVSLLDLGHPPNGALDVSGYREFTIKNY